MTEQEIDKRFAELKAEGKSDYQACQVLMQEGVPMQAAADATFRADKKPLPPRPCEGKYAPYTRGHAAYYRTFEKNHYGE